MLSGAALPLTKSPQTEMSSFLPTHFLMGSEQKLILMFSECPSTLTEQFQLLFSRGKSELVGQAQVQVDLILKVLNLIYFTFEAGFFVFKTVFSCWS